MTLGPSQWSRKMLTLAQTHWWHWSPLDTGKVTNIIIRATNVQPAETGQTPEGTFLDEFATVRLNFSGFGFHLVIWMTGFLFKTNNEKVKSYL